MKKTKLVTVYIVIFLVLILSIFLTSLMSYYSAITYESAKYYFINQIIQTVSMIIIGVLAGVTMFPTDKFTKISYLTNTLVFGLFAVISLTLPFISFNSFHQGYVLLDYSSYTFWCIAGINAFCFFKKLCKNKS